MSTRLHFHLFSWLFLALISAKPLHSEVSIKASVCNERDFEKGGPFDEILNQTLSCLLRVTALRKLNFCIERNTQTAYGFSQCRGDLRPGDCSHCIRVARDTALSDCEGKSMGRVYGDKCLLFYQDSEFSGDDFEEPVQGPECSEERSKDPTRFAAGVGGLVASLSVEAQRTEGFATGSEWVGGVSGKVFGVAQCWGVMGDKCGSCLSKARVALSGICRTSVEGVVAFDGCYLRYQNYPFSSSDRMLAPHSPESSPVDGRQQPSVPLKISSSRKFTLFFFLGCLILVVIIVLLLIIGWKFIKHAKLRKNTDSETTRSAPNFFFSGNLRTISYFDYRTLRKATSNFHLGNKLGSGGFGPVYQGVLDDGRIIAVKKLALEKSQQGEAEFLAEVRLITSIQHKNLLRLLGCCSDGPERLLVYEYMKNKSLDLIVYGKRGKFLNWQTRFQIILGIARGLQYLHEDSHIRIVHRDIKASNILLDEKFQPRIGDFGLARFFPEDQAYLSTKFAGTLGYTAPEYAIRGELSEKADIYSFGVLVLEIVSCRKNTDLTLPSEMQYLPEYAWRMYEKSRVVDLMDPELRVDGLVERDILCVIKVAFLCLQSNPNQRPPMSEIVAMLTCKPEMTGSPRKPVFFNHRHRTDEKIYWDTISQASSSPLPSDSPSLVDPISHRCTNN